MAGVVHTLRGMALVLLIVFSEEVDAMAVVGICRACHGHGAHVSGGGALGGSAPGRAVQGVQCQGIIAAHFSWPVPTEHIMVALDIIN